MRINIESFHHRWFKARQMALMGFVTRIIILETGLTDKQLRRLYKELEADGYDLKRGRNTRTVRSGATLLHNQLAKSHASILMQLYRRIGGEDIHTSISIKALGWSFRMYRALMHELEAIDYAMARSVSFSISDAWCLASELRSEEAFFESCRDCGCSVFTSINQSTGISCPFCYEIASRGKAMSQVEGMSAMVPAQKEDAVSACEMVAVE